MMLKQQLIEILEDFPEKGYQNDLKEVEMRDEIKSKRSNIDRIEARVVAEILTDSKKEEWKEALSNAQKRDQERKNRLEMIQEYQDLTTSLTEQEKELTLHEKKSLRDYREWRSAIARAQLE